MDSLKQFVANPLIWLAELAQNSLEILAQPMGWIHPAMVMTYAYILLGLGGGLICLVLRDLVREKQAELARDLPEIRAMIAETHQELRQIGRQVDDGVDTLQNLHTIIKTFVLNLIQIQLLAWLVKRLSKHSFGLRFAAQKAVQAAFKQLKAKMMRS